ncbi:hypothetical protein FACS18947_5730 [Bacteroidia bacterium]|nr:hypothetical protein FACS18947_5730 [Bacteroidia bacterium]
MIKRHTIQSDMKRAICSKGFIMGVAGLFIVIVFASMESIIEVTRATEPLQNGFHAEFILKSLQSDSFTLALPILCALPFTTAFVDDIKSGFIKQYLLRTSRKQYIKGKLVACGLSGGLVLFIGILAAFQMAYLVFTPMELALTEGQTAEPYLAQLIMKAFILAISGMFWSLIGFTFAALTMNRYMAYASPLILYYVLIILHERYFEWLYVLYPKEWLFPANEWTLGDLGIILLIIELALITGLWFAIIAKRRLNDA